MYIWCLLTYALTPPADFYSNYVDDDLQIITKRKLQVLWIPPYVHCIWPVFKEGEQNEHDFPSSI